MDSHEQFLRMAIDLATKNVATGAGGPFGAVIVRDNEIVATGVNKVTTSCDPTAHAEITAIRAATVALGHFELTGCTLYSSCEPCPMCLGAIYWSRCEALYFGSTAGDAAAAGFDDSFIYDEIRKPLGQRRLHSYNLLREEAGASFKAWSEATSRIEY